MCERGRILTRGLQCSAQGFAGASGDVRAEMCERGRILTQCLQCSAQCLAGASGGELAGVKRLTGTNF